VLLEPVFDFGEVLLITYHFGECVTRILGEHTRAHGVAARGEKRAGEREPRQGQINDTTSAVETHALLEVGNRRVGMVQGELGITQASQRVRIIDAIDSDRALRFLRSE